MNTVSNGSRRDRARVPRATYRIQLNKDFRFADAARIVPYIAALGISHLYCSPIVAARPGSMHGYDVIDHSTLNPELGTRADFDALVAALHQHDMGMIVDIVPNHVGVMGDNNAWWLDVLENGPAAQFAPYFDVDWRPNRSSMQNRILVPVLGTPYGSVLENGELKISYDVATGSFSLRYYQHLFPVDPKTYPLIFVPSREELSAQLPIDDPNRQDFESLLDAFARLPSRSAVSSDERAMRYRDKEVHKRRLVRLCERSPEIVRHIELALQRLNGTVGESASFDGLDVLIDAQAYRLASWRVAVDEINYRRFFDVNDLAALRMEQSQVFETTHALMFELIEQGSVDGLRIDHPDGLYDPKQYFERLQQRFRARAPDQAKPLYVVVEKILAAHEHLQEDWPVHGTTGYDFAGLLNSWFVDAASEVAMTRTYRAYLRRQEDYVEVVYNGRKLVMRIALAAEVGVLATQLDRIAQLDRRTSDFTRAALRDAIMEVIACFPVYRTYIADGEPTEEDRRAIYWAVNLARKRSQAAELTVFDFLSTVLLGETIQGRPEERRLLMREFARKFQQVTSPVTAKGVEDTAFYRYYRLLSLNEVGGEPRRYGASTANLHQANADRARSWPMAMLATSTHDTKRSEDVRARIAVLSELPDLWRKHLARWDRLNRLRRREVDGAPVPSRNDEYMLYQTLVGVWPIDPAEQRAPELVERVRAYVVKAAREAKIDTSWINPIEAYEQAFQDFVAAVLEPTEHNAFLKDFSAFAEHIAYFGHLNSIVQTVLKLTAPGVPDFFQGTELPVFSLVDPDNRRPVDFERARELLSRVKADLARDAPAAVASAATEWKSGRAKLLMTAKLLELRSQHAALFLKGSYEPLRVGGEHAEHVAAYIRRYEGQVLIVVVSRWLAKLSAGESERLQPQIWADTRVELPASALPEQTNTLSCCLSGRRFELERGADDALSITASRAFADLPAAVFCVETRSGCS
ncbi:MAG TPA: malto-oligosyltrehalose synthase [Steroidobacteraceae bacterium]|nr:malto-oligosyltrehalose synthase [Steroidobacteraceae bacterium]